jgi:hypothetical protein
MTPAAVSFDTYEFVTQLKDSGMDEKEAECLTKAFTNAVSQLEVVTRTDLIMIKLDITETKAALKDDIKNLELDLKHFIIKCFTTFVTLITGIQIVLRFFGKG